LIRVGTRASPLALAQASWVAQLLESDAELVTVLTDGDRGRSELDKSRWVSALENALLRGEIDVAVHSAKDVPVGLPDGLALVAVPARADHRDALCGYPSLASLPPGGRVGTGSLRRTAQLRAIRPDLEVIPIRGNVDTRLRKLAEGQCDALVLAQAGLERLGRAGEAGALLDELVPAAGQGALVLEARPGHLPEEPLSRVNDSETALCLEAEREVVRRLGASCHTPLGVHGRIVDGQLQLEAWLGLGDGSHWMADRLEGSPADVPGALVDRLEAVGARELLRAAEAAG
jgi:hydroxymethylbilane synthase